MAFKGKKYLTLKCKFNVILYYKLKVITRRNVLLTYSIKKYFKRKMNQVF